MICLVVDLGNTLCKYAIMLNGQIVSKGAYPVLLNEHIDAIFSTYPDIRHCIFSSVRGKDPDLLGSLSSHCHTIELSKELPLPIGMNYSGNPGNDRLASAVAAAVLNPAGNSLIVDTGTCITYTVVHSNIFIGGAISPGIDIRFRSLNEFTANLPLLSLTEEAIALCGNSTDASIRSGVINAVKLEVDGMISRFEAEFPQLKVFLTGGYSGFFEKALKNGIFADPDLVLKGLYHILKFNADTRS